MAEDYISKIKDLIKHETVSEVSRPLIYLLGIVVVLVFLLYIGYGSRTVTSDAVCSQDVDICHGIPLGDNCLGVERNNTYFDSPNQCTEYDWIQYVCEGHGNLGGIESLSEFEVASMTCQEWTEVYDLEIPDNLN